VFADQKEKATDAQLLIEMKTICKQMNLQPTEKFLLCIEKMFDLIKVKQGVIILGQPFAGKTSAYKVLAAALNEIVTLSFYFISLILLNTLIQGDAKNPNIDYQPKITHFEPTVRCVRPYDA
jgi:Hydrolytic ATP binding site of dynein motor region